MYELISDLKELGYWKKLLCKESMRTLDRYTIKWIIREMEREV